jgi:hypothetical protein
MARCLFFSRLACACYKWGFCKSVGNICGIRAVLLLYFPSYTVLYCSSCCVSSYSSCIFLQYSRTTAVLYSTHNSAAAECTKMLRCGLRIYIHICTNKYLCICIISLFRIILKEMVFSSYTVMKVGTYFVC